MTTQWQILGWPLLAIAAALLLYALFARRIAWSRKTKRRCPKCWYDMSHTEGLQCPECGRTWKRESKLYTCRRRRLTFVVALLLLILAAPALRIDALRHEGWTGLVPTPVLAVTAEWYLDVNDAWHAPGTIGWFHDTPMPLRVRLATHLRDAFDARLYGMSFDDDPPWTERHLVSSMRTLLARADQRIAVNAGRNAGGFSRALIAMEFAETSGLIDEQSADRARDATWIGVELAGEWRAGGTMYGTVNLASGSPIFGSQHRITTLDHQGQVLDQQIISSHRFRPHTFALPEALSFGRVAAGTHRRTWTIVIERPRLTASLDDDQLEWEEIERRSFSMTVTGLESIDECITPITIADIERAFDAPVNIRHRASNQSDDLQLSGDWITLRNRLCAAHALTFAVRFELLADGRVIADDGGCWLTHDTPLSDQQTGRDRVIPLNRTRTPFDLTDASTLTLRITSDPERALRCAAPRRIWIGSVELPVTRAADGD